MITNGAGKVQFTFRIPEYRFAGQESALRFKTGDVEFRLTSSSIDDRSTSPLTAAQEIYSAKGVLETEQETIIATRNARVIQTTVNQVTSRLTETTKDRLFKRRLARNGLQADQRLRVKLIRDGKFVPMWPDCFRWIKNGQYEQFLELREQKSKSRLNPMLAKKASDQPF